MKEFDLDQIDPLDRPLYGVEAFARVLNRKPRRVYDDLEKGRLAGYVKKWGRVWTSTPRRLLKSLEPAPADTDRNA
jgi:hypothetical protein